jgi:F-type H+-transporting ATPase subunit b
MEKLILPAVHLFGLVAFIIYKTKGSFVQFMETRHTEMSDGLNKAKIQAASAAAKKKEIEAKFAGLENEKNLIIAEWKEKEAAQLKAIRESSAKLIAQMTIEAEQNKKSLEQQIRNQVMKKYAEQIIVQVEDKVKKGLNEQTHKGMVEQFINEVSA